MGFGTVHTGGAGGPCLARLPESTRLTPALHPSPPTPPRPPLFPGLECSGGPCAGGRVPPLCVGARGGAGVRGAARGAPHPHPVLRGHGQVGR